jgi:hypothetical protein
MSSPLFKKKESVSPSSFEQLRLWKEGKVCPVRLLQGKSHYLAPYPAAKVGDIFHYVQEQTAKTSCSTEPETLWDVKAREIEEELKKNWVSERLVPLSETSGRYTLKRLMAISLAAKPDSKRLSGENAVRGPGNGNSSSLTEQMFVSTNGKVKGKPDSVVETSKGWILYDYKTGKITEQLEGGDEAFKESYELQLKLYAGLLWQDEKISIKEAYLVTEDGAEHPVEINIEESDQLLAEAGALLDEFNESFADTGLAFEQAQALPWDAIHKISGCSGCGYRPVCPVYFSSERTAQEGAHWTKDTRGIIKEIKKLQGSVDVLITMDPVGLDVVKTIRISPRHPALNAVMEGDEIVIFDYVGTQSMKGDGPRTCIYHYKENPTEEWQLPLDILVEK